MSDIPRGAIRFNTDSNKPELWDGSQWAEFQLSTPNLGTSRVIVNLVLVDYGHAGGENSPVGNVNTAVIDAINYMHQLESAV